jgi:hypothetical protein
MLSLLVLNHQLCVRSAQKSQNGIEQNIARMRTRAQWKSGIGTY